MSLITRCPVCGTMFKVVSDQLKVSQGWVRCGQCTEVFDASVHLLPRGTKEVPAAALPTVSAVPAYSPVADSAAPSGLPTLPTLESSETVAPPEPPASPIGTTPVTSAADQHADELDPAAWKQWELERQHLDFAALYARAASAGPAAGAGATHGDAVDLPPPRPALMNKPVLEDAHLPADGAREGAELSAFPASDEDAEQLAGEVASDVSFVRDARRKAFWAKPMVRGLLVCFSVLLAAGLFLQWALHQRDTLVAMEPRAAPLLRMLCQYLRCEIRAPRHIESLVIEGSTFSRIEPDAYRLSFSLKNTRGIALQIPFVEVTLTDAQDRAIVRRVLGPAEFGVNAATLAAQSELAGVVYLKVFADGSGAAGPSSAPPALVLPLPVAGYRVLAFYPD